MSGEDDLSFAGRYTGQAPGAQVPVIHMSPGHFQTIWLTGSGSVYVLGSDNLGQLGNGTIGRTDFSSVPVHVNLPGPMKQVGSGMGTCWAVSADGRQVYAWGDNSHGQLGIGNRSVRQSPLPREVHLHLPPGVTVVQMADGLKAEMALLSNGKVLAWGDDRFGESGHSPSAYGKYQYNPRIVHGLKNVTELAAGDYYSMALESNGSVWAWGQDTSGELGPNGPTAAKHAHSVKPVQVTGLPKIQDIVAGGKNGIAVDETGHVWEWGRNEFGELGNGTVGPGDSPHPIPSMVQGLPPVVSLDSEGPTVLAADAGGNIYSWGFNKWGAVGDGSTANTGTPHLVLTMPTSPDGQEPSVQVAAAHRSSYAYNVVTGQTYAWGENNLGQIGIKANNVPNPTPINITSVVAPTLATDASEANDVPVCFVAGTRIRIASGDRPVETLAIGDLVVTSRGAHRPVKWLGRRRISFRHHPNAAAALPIRIAPHAFGANRPARELLVSPGHAICLDLAGEVLVPAGALVDGTTVSRIDVSEVDYWHVELETHDLLLAENLACESYLEMGNRGFFADQSVVELHAMPDRPTPTHDAFCRPFHQAGPIVEAVRLRLSRSPERREPCRGVEAAA